MTSTDVATAGIGHNLPPQTPFEIASERCDLLHLEAKNWFDGDPIENEGQADAIKKLLADVRAASKAADDARKIENKPFDEGKAKVQERYQTMLGKGKKPGRFDMIADTCKEVLAPWLVKVQEKIDAAAAVARREADEAAAKARAAVATTDQTNLEAREETERYIDDAKALEAHATHAAKVTSGDKTVSLRSKFTPAITDFYTCIRHYWNTDKPALEALILDLVVRDVRAGKRNIPGVEITEERVAR